MPTLATLFITPVNAATLAAQVSIRLKATDLTGTLSDYTLTLNGITLDEPELESGQYVLLVDTRLFFNGSQTLRADAMHSVTGAVYQTLTVTLDNALQTNVEYHVLDVVNQRGGQRVTMINTGLKTFELPTINRLRYWMQTRAFSEATPGAGDVPELDPEDLEALAAAWLKGQPVTLESAKPTTALRTRLASLWHYASEKLLTYPGQTICWMLRQEPEELVSWWETGYEVIGKIRCDETASITGTEVWYLLARNTDLSGAAIFRYSVTGSLEAPETSFEKIIDLDEDAPDAIDFAVVGTKVYVLRDENTLYLVFDLDSGEVLLEQRIKREERFPLLIENCGGAPILLTVDASLAGTTGLERTVAYDLTFDRPEEVWRLQYAAGIARYAPTVARLGITAGTRLYSSAAGTGAPALGHTFGTNITALGIGPADSLTGLTDGKVYSGDNVLLTTLATGVTALGIWKSDGEADRAVAGRADDQLAEQGRNALWAAGSALEPPEGAVATVTALEGFARLITASSGTEGQPDFVPAVIEHRLLIGTGNDGLLGALQRSTLTSAAGAFLAYEHDESYLIPLASPIPA